MNRRLRLYAEMTSAVIEGNLDHKRPSIFELDRRAPAGNLPVFELFVRGVPQQPKRPISNRPIWRHLCTFGGDRIGDPIRKNNPR